MSRVGVRYRRSMAERPPCSRRKTEAPCRSSVATIPSRSPAKRRTVQTKVPRENRILASLPAADLALLAPHLHVITLERGLLHQQDRPQDCAYFPHEGLISLLATTPEGQ